MSVLQETLLYSFLLSEGSGRAAYELYEQSLGRGKNIRKANCIDNNWAKFKYTDGKIDYPFKFEGCAFSALPISCNKYIFDVLIGSTYFLSGYLSVKNVDS